MVEVVIARAVYKRMHSRRNPGQSISAVAFDSIEDLVGLPEDEDEDVNPIYRKYYRTGQLNRRWFTMFPTSC